MRSSAKLHGIDCSQIHFIILSIRAFYANSWRNIYSKWFVFDSCVFLFFSLSLFSFFFQLSFTVLNMTTKDSNSAINDEMEIQVLISRLESDSMECLSDVFRQNTNCQQRWRAQHLIQFVNWFREAYHWYMCLLSLFIEMNARKKHKWT